MGIVGSARNITNQKLMEQALAESEQKFRTFFENEPEYCYMISPQGTILEANSTALSVLGYAKEELIGKPIESLYAPELYERGRQLLSQWKQTGEIRNEEMVIITRNGDRRTVLLSSAQVLGENGKSLHSISIQRDITESKKAQEELKKSKEFLDNVINSLDDSFFIKDQEHRWLMLNDAACELIGRPREELIGKSDYDIFPKEQANVFWEKDSLVFETGRTNVNEEHVTWHDRVHTISSKKSLYTDPVTGQKFITGINRDITERKRLEEAHRSLVDNSLQGLAIVQDGRMVFINKAFTSTTGYSREDLLAASPEQLQSMVHPDDRELIWLRHRDRIAGKPVPARYEFRWIRKDGSTCWVEIYASRIEYQGRPAIQTAYIDITERKQAEEALFKEKKFTEDAINAQMDTFFVFETGTGKAIRWNKAFTDISGYTDEEIAGLPAPASYYSSEDLERAAAFIQNVLKEGVGTIELELICKDGRKVPTEYRVSLINDDQGEPKYFISIGRDITECKRAEEAMKKSSVIIDSTADAVITSDITGNITFWNKGAEIIYGYQKEEAVGKPVSILYKEENLHVLEAMIADLLEGKDIPGIEATCINKKQQDVEILLSLTSIRDADGNVTEFVGITKDITERKRMEERVAKSRELFSKIFYANPIPATITTVSNDKLLMVNDAWLKLMGFDSQEEAIGKSAVDLGLWADIEDREERNINLQQEGSSDIQEMRVHTPSGRIRDCLYTAEMIEYESQPHILSTAIDITERKKAQQKLLEYQRQLKSLASELLLAEERERRRIATGVHDDIGQKLALAKLELQSMNEIVTEPDVSASLGHACELVDKAMQDARSLAFDLSNPVLYEVGFAAAVESLLTERMMQKSGIKFEFKSKTRKLKLGQDMSIVLFQAVRELLTNVVKHANANKVKVCIDKSDNRVHVIVEDDGAGFELPKLQSPDRKKGGFGLFNVKERLEYLGGSFDIKSKPRQGTRVIMAVPLEPGIMTS
jgi:PAS domain S-box-containing protein